ncbi:MAG: hypothetical protein R6W78_04670 [Bacteroidales bacterium]
MKTKKDKVEFLKAVLSGDKTAVKRIIKQGSPDVFWFENGKYFQSIQGVWRETEKRPDEDDVLICYNAPETVESKIISVQSKRTAEEISKMANE